MFYGTHNILDFNLKSLCHVIFSYFGFRFRELSSDETLRRVSPPQTSNTERNKSEVNSKNHRLSSSSVNIAYSSLSTFNITGPWGGIYPYKILAGKGSDRRQRFALHTNLVVRLVSRVRVVSKESLWVSLCNPPIVPRQRLSKHVPAAKNYCSGPRFLCGPFRNKEK
jgi:hypothetical protein